MSEFGAGRTRVRRVLSTAPVIETNVPEFSTGTGVVTVTKLLRGQPGQDGEDGVGVTPETTTLAYDVDGKLTTVTKVSGVTTLTYDGNDMLATVVKPDHTKTMTYDVDDRLVTITVS
jgi:YD repeat-containing protein